MDSKQEEKNSFSYKNVEFYFLLWTKDLILTQNNNGFVI